MESAHPDPKAGRDPADAMVTRRQLLVGAGATALVVGCSTSDTGQRSSSTSPLPTASRPAAASTSTTSLTSPPTAPVACVLTPELTAGPYYLDGHLARRDITEGRPGAPMEFSVRVLGLPDCAPLAGAAVDIWQCDAGGEYSGFNGNSLAATGAGGTNDKRYLRGVQRTDAAGIATFATIFPGWYEGRTVHVHLKVIEGGTLGTTYAGGHVAHVGQAFFDETLTAQILERDPYRERTGTRTTNDQDSIFAQAGAGAITALTTQTGEGLTGTVTCLVDPTATPPPAPLF